MIMMVIRENSSTKPNRMYPYTKSQKYIFMQAIAD